MKYIKIYLPIIIFTYFFTFLIGVNTGVYKVFPYELLASAKHTLEDLLQGKTEQTLFDEGKTSEDSSFSNLWHSIEFDKSTKATHESILNNFELRWERVESDVLGKTGAVSFSKDSVKFVNRDDKTILGLLGLLDKFSSRHDGGIRTIFEVNGIEYAYVAYVNDECASASIYNLVTYKTVLDFSCLPENPKDPADLVDLNVTGGAILKTSDNRLLMSTGTPTSFSETNAIRNLAQDDNSYWGKFLELTFTDDDVSVKVFSKGHRNPQGVFKYGNQIYAVDHGPMGGDEVNILERGMNYGWPNQSLGAHYNLNPINKSYGSAVRVEKPLFAFVPSIGISFIGKCPSIYESYYSPANCLAVSSMRAASLFFIVFDKDNHVLFTEKIEFGSRIRKFQIDENFLIAVTDFEGVIVGRFFQIKTKGKW